MMWQPIETAPKDGRVILVWTKHGKVPVPAFYKTAWYRNCLLPSFREVGSNWVSVRPLYEMDFSMGWIEENVLALERVPTHWTHIPMYGPEVAEHLDEDAKAARFLATVGMYYFRQLAETSHPQGKAALETAERYAKE